MKRTFVLWLVIVCAFALLAVSLSADTTSASEGSADNATSEAASADTAITETVSADSVTVVVAPAAPESVIVGYVNQILINAGGPYQAMRNRPVRLLGNAKSRFGEIVRYEWRFTNAENPEFVTDSNVVVYFTYPDAGRYRAIFTVWAEDGTYARDTAIVNVGGRMPVANAGENVMSRAGRRIKLNGTGSSPDGGKIVRYEWDFDGSGAFDWSSETSGSTTRVFHIYSHPVLRVTDCEGNTAYDTARIIICPRGMATVSGGKFCIDQYEWPNRRRALPQTNVTYAEAVAACEGVGKRLCTPEEWTRACRNDSNIKPADGHSYPYGNDYDFMRCNTLDNPRTRNAPNRAGALNRCAGALQLYDMSGNVSEWTAADGSQAPVYGGFYQSTAEDSGCESRLMLDKDKPYLYVGFRCCK